MAVRVADPAGDSWRQALHEMTAEGRLEAGVEREIVRRQSSIAALQQHTTLRARIVELSGYAGAALILAGLVAVGSQFWSDAAWLLQIVVTGGLGALLAVAAWTVLVRTPGGRSGVVEHPARGRLVGVLGVAAAVLAAATVQLMVGELAAEPHLWLPAVFGTGLLGAALTAWAAPGAVPTLAVAVGSGTTLLSAMENLRWLEEPALFGSAFLALAVLGTFVLVRVLVPAVLVEVVSLATWVVAGAAMGAESGSAMWIGRAALLVLAVLGSALFVRGARWPFAVGAAVALAALIWVSFTDALGGAVAMIIAGVLLVAVSGLLSVLRHQAESTSGG